MNTKADNTASNLEQLTKKLSDAAELIMDAVAIVKAQPKDSLRKSVNSSLQSQYGKVTMPGELASKKIFAIHSLTNNVICVYAGTGYLSCYTVSQKGLTPYNGVFRFNCLYDD